MNPWIYIPFSIIVAAVIGAVTNHLAIKMLFHPRTELRFLGLRVPFTPGLFPKRKDEIGRALGHVVADYLVTTEGLIGVWRKPEFQEKIRRRLESAIERWAVCEDTVGELAVRWTGAEDAEKLRDSIAEFLESAAHRGVEWLWNKQGLGSAELRSLVPGWNEERKQTAANVLAQYALSELRKEIVSLEGNVLIRRLTGQLLGQAGGMLGALAGIFMDEDKLARRVSDVLAEQLESPAIRGVAAAFILRKLNEWEQATLEQTISAFAQEDAVTWVKEKAAEVVDGHRLAGILFELKIGEMLGPYKESLLRGVPWGQERLSAVLESNSEKMIQSIELPKLVEAQVGQFPVERIEEIILSVSGKEFRAITWLGGLLGGMIGLFQSIVILLFGNGG